MRTYNEKYKAFQIWFLQYLRSPGAKLGLQSRAPDQFLPSWANPPNPCFAIESKSCQHALTKGQGPLGAFSLPGRRSRHRSLG